MADDDRHVIRNAARLTIRGLTLGLAAWAATAGIREAIKRRSETAIELAGERGMDRIPADPPAPADRPAEIDLREPTVPSPAEPPAVETVTAPEQMPEQTPDQPPVPEAERAPAAASEQADLPLADFDSITVASLRARLRRLSREDLGVLQAHELGHGNRPEILSMLNNRIAKLDEA